jgi:hypothetical protein
VEKEIVSEDKPKPVLDEETLDKLLEAAYVLQEHNRELQEMEVGLSLKRDQLEAEDRSATVPHPSVPSQTPGTEPTTDYTLILAKIVELQRQIQLRQLELSNAISLVTERLTEIASASGAAVGILEGKKLRYRAATGLLTLPPGTVVPLEKALCVACIRTGQAFRRESGISSRCGRMPPPGHPIPDCGSNFSRRHGGWGLGSLLPHRACLHRSGCTYVSTDGGIGDGSAGAGRRSHIEEIARD